MAGMFEHTQGKYWGGPWYRYWTLIVISVVGGFIGLDHLWMRSPSTALLKALLLIPTLGLWYFYDLIQIFGDKENVMKYGLTAPLMGALGIGAEIFVDDHPQAVKLSKSPFRYLLYLFLTSFPFGFDFFVAGDTNGAMARFLTSILYFLWPIGFIWGCFNIIKAVFLPKSLFDEGTTRMFPFSFFMNPTGPSKLGPIDIGYDNNCSPGGSHGFFGGIFYGILGIFETILSSVVAVLLPGVQPLVFAIAAAGTAIMTLVRSLFGLSSQVVQAATPPIVTGVGVGAQVSRLVGTTSPADFAGAAARASEAGAAARASQVAAVAAAGTRGGAVMAGGAILAKDTVAFPALIFVLVTILGVGSVLGFLELKRQYDLSRNVDESTVPGSRKDQRTDTPPKPYVL